MANKCHLNLVFLDQPRENKIFFNNNLTNIILIKDKKRIIFAKKSIVFYLKSYYN